MPSINLSESVALNTIPMLLTRLVWDLLAKPSIIFALEPEIATMYLHDHDRYCRLARSDTVKYATGELTSALDGQAFKEPPGPAGSHG